MKLTTKEQGLLADLSSQEKLCIEKYGQYANDACDGELKNLFTNLQQNEKRHLDMITQMQNGTVPQVGGGAQQGNQNCNCAPCDCGCTPDTNRDAFLCKDALSMEKHVSSVYDVSIFEFSDVGMRNVLNHIQKEEQEHGEKLYSYMSAHNIYA